MAISKGLTAHIHNWKIFLILYRFSNKLNWGTWH
jgi:hypothetical protein